MSNKYVQTNPKDVSSRTGHIPTIALFKKGFKPTIILTDMK